MGYGDITPASVIEIWINIIIMISGLALFASILSSLVDIVASASRQARKATAVRNKLTDIQVCCSGAMFARMGYGQRKWQTSTGASTPP